MTKKTPSAKSYRSEPFGIEQEVLDNVTHYEVRKFLGRGKWDVHNCDTLDKANSIFDQMKRDKVHSCGIWAVGTIPSRGGRTGVHLIRS